MTRQLYSANRSFEQKETQPGLTVTFLCMKGKMAKVLRSDMMESEHETNPEKNCFVSQEHVKVAGRTAGKGI